MHKFIAFLSDERGATAVEYGLIVAMLAVGCIAAFTVLGGDLQSLFGASENGVGDRLTEAAGTL